MKKVMKLRQIIFGLWSLLWMSMGFAADPIPTYRLVNGGSAGSDIKVLNLSSASNTISGASPNTFSSFSVNAGEIGTIASSGLAAGGSITGSGPFIAVGTGDGTGMPLFVPDFAGQTFIIPHYSGSHKYYLYNPTGSAISVTVTLNGTPDTFNLASGLTEYDAGSTNTISGIVESASNIYVAHRENGGTSWAYAVPPAARSVLGVKSGSVLLGASEDDTSVTVYTSANTSATIDLDAGERVVVSAGTGATQNNGDALRLVSNNSSKPIAAIQVDDGDGSQATAFWSENLLSLHSGLAVNTQYVAVVCRDSAVIKLHDGTTTTTQNCTANGNYPGKAYFGSTSNGTSINAGARLESSSPVYFVAENSANDDETNLWSYEPDVIVVNTTTATTISTDTTWHTGKIYEINKNVTISSGVTLTIEAGATVRTSNSAATTIDFIVNGTLQAQGTQLAPVVFTSDYSPHRITSNTSPYYDWGGILVNTGGVATFDYAVVEYAQYGIYFDNTGSAGYVKNSVIQYNNDGIFLNENVDIEILDSTIEDNRGSGIELDSTTSATANATPTIKRNIIVGNHDGLVVHGENSAVRDPLPVVQKNAFSYTDSQNVTKANIYYSYQISNAFLAGSGGAPVSATLNADCNFWGTTTPASIPAEIYDENNSTALNVYVDYNHFAMNQDIILPSTTTPCSQDEYLMGIQYNKTISLSASHHNEVISPLILSGTTTLTMGVGAALDIVDTSTSLVIQSGATMTVDKGATITIKATAANQTSVIDVYGTLDMEGDELTYVVIKSDQTTLDSDVSYWDGIKVRSGGLAYLDYVVLQQSDGVQYYDGSQGYVSYSLLQYNKYGVYIEGDADIFSLANKYVYNEYGFYVVGGSTGTGQHKPEPASYFDTIASNEVYGIYLDGNGNANDPDPFVSLGIVILNGSGSETDYKIAGTWLNSQAVLQATDTYWGYDNYVDVSENAIYDHMDSGVMPYVNYGQIFTDISSEQVHQETGETLVGAIVTSQTLATNTTYTLISALDITNSSTLTVASGATLVVPKGFNINIASGATLLFATGSKVIFEDTTSKITVNGVLEVAGSAVSPVIFTSDDVGKSKWQGVVVNTGGTVDVDYLWLENASTGFYFADSSSGTITHSSLTNNNYGIHIYGDASPEISYSDLAENNRAINIEAYSSASGYAEPNISYNNINENDYGIYIIPVSNVNRDPKPVINYNKLINNASGNVFLPSNGYYAVADVAIDARWNWWGSAEPAVISSTIINDRQNDPSVTSYNRVSINYGNYALTNALSSFKANTLIGRFTENTTLTAGTVYTVLGHLIVPGGVTLTVGYGSRFEFPLMTGVDDPIEIAVSGTMFVNGDNSSTTTTTEYTEFTSYEDSPTTNDWNGFLVTSGGRLSIDHGIIEYASVGILYDDGTDARSDLWNSIVRHIYNAGVKIQGGLTAHNDRPDGIWFIGNIFDDLQYGAYIDIESGSPAYDTHKPTKAKFVFNWIKNTTNGIWIGSDGGSDPDYNPVIIINTNGFTNNSPYNLYLESGTWPSAGYVDATYNMWGVFDPAAIAASIHDKQDVVNATDRTNTPYVDYTNYAIEWIDEDTLLSNANDILGPVDQDLTLSTANGNDFVTLIGDVTVAEGVKLTVEPGVQFYVSGNYKLIVDGVLDVNGSSSDPVVFASRDLNPGDDNWGGIYVSDTGVAEIEYAVIKNAVTGVTFDSVPASVTLGGTTYYNKLAYSTVQYNQKGIWFLDTPSSLPVSNNLIQFNDYGLYFQGSAGASVNYNLIKGNGTGIYLLGNTTTSSQNPTPVINNNSIYGNSTYGNSTYDVQMQAYHSSVTVDLKSNWWGSSSAPTKSTSGSPNVYLSGGSASANADISTYLTSAPSGIATAAVSYITLDQDYISPNNDSVKDDVDISGTLIQSDSWTVKVRNYAGDVVKTYTGTGTSVSATWDGKNTSGTVQPDGLYRVEIWTTVLILSGYVIVDTTSPVAVIDAVNNTTLTAIQTLQIPGRASDNNISNYTLKYEKNGVSCPASTCVTLADINGASVYSNVLGSWVLGSSTVAPPPNGAYTVSLVVTDKAGNTASTTATVTLDLVALTNVTQNTRMIDVGDSEQLEVSFNLSTDADWVKLRIYPELGGDLVREVTGNNLSAGSNTLVWDGKDTNGANVPREAYKYTLTADLAGSSTSQYVYDPAPGQASTCSVSITQASSDESFNAYTNDVWKTSLTLAAGTQCNRGIRVTIEARPPANSPYAWTDIIRDKPFITGTYPVEWDGIDKNGLRVQGSVDIWMRDDAFFPQLRDNSVIVEPKVTIVKGGTLSQPTVEVKSNPSLVFHSYDQYFSFDYNLDRESYVVITLLPPGITSVSDPAAIQVYNTTTCGTCSISGNQALTWYGHDATDTNEILVSTEGAYSYVIEATAVGGAKTTVKGVVTIYR